jgi:hypothetical protein
MGSMACYDKSVNSSKELSRWGIEAGLTVPYEVGAAGVVIYQENEAVLEPAQLAAQLTNVTGAATTKKCTTRAHARSSELYALRPLDLGKRRSTRSRVPGQNSRLCHVTVLWAWAVHSARRARDHIHGSQR